MGDNIADVKAIWREVARGNIHVKCIRRGPKSALNMSTPLPTEDEIDETPRIRPEDAEKYIPRS